MTTISLILSVLSLVVAVCAVFVARANVQWQLQVAAREAWIREFREQAALFLARLNALRDVIRSPQDEETTKRKREIIDALLPALHTIQLLLIERGEEQYPVFLQTMEHAVTPAVRYDPARLTDVLFEFRKETESVLKCERAAIETSGMWRRLRGGLGAVRWRPWLQLKAWLGRDPPRWPT